MLYKLHEENCSKLCYFLFLIFRTDLYNFILFKSVVETKLFEACAYCLQANF